MKKIERYGLLVIAIFTFLFALTLPFPFAFIPSLSLAISRVLQPVVHCVANQLCDSCLDSSSFTLESDSLGFYYQTLFLFSISLLLALLVFKRLKTIETNQIYALLNLVASYLLALFLLKYGCDKIFKVQFFFPEPNTLFTPLGFLSKDILFWSTMGSSYSYSLFLGILEIIPALLLLHRKTRFVGALIAFGVLLHVLLINLSFDISVKILSSYLVLLSVICIWPFRRILIDFFWHKKTIIDYPNFLAFHFFQSIHFRALKSILVCVFLCESCYFFIENKIFNDDLVPRPKMHGAYQVMPDKSKTGIAQIVQSSQFGDIQQIKRIFFHRRGYLIFQYNNEKLLDFPGYFDEKKHQFRLMTAENSIKISVQYNPLKKYYQFKWKEYNSNKHVTHYFQLNTQKINLSELPLSLPLFHWTVKD